MIVIVLTNGTKITTPNDRTLMRVGNDLKIVSRDIEKTIEWSSIAHIRVEKDRG